MVARRKAVVSAKIQGRLSELRVEEGSRSCARARCSRGSRAIDYEAAVARARAAVQRAEADLAEAERQLRLADELAKQKVVSDDQREAAASRVQDRARRRSRRRTPTCRFAEAQLAEHA